MEERRPEEVQHWTTTRRAALVFSLLSGETRAAETARRHELKVAEVEQWRAGFQSKAENALSRQEDDKALREEKMIGSSAKWPS